VNVHAQVASQLESTICELDELKVRPSLLGACLECPKLKLELDACSLNVKKFETKLLEKSHVSVTSSPCELCVSLKGKLVHATNENTMLVQDVAYLTSQLERTKLSEKMIEENLSQVDECVTCSIHKLDLGYERCEDKGEVSTKFVPSSTYNNEEAFVCMFCGHVGHLDEFCFRCKRIEKRHFNYARNSYQDEFIDFPPHSYSCALPRTSSHALPQFSHGPNHHSYGFGL
jgi:hypothetical protein